MRNGVNLPYKDTSHYPERVGALVCVADHHGRGPLWLGEGVGRGWGGGRSMMYITSSLDRQLYRLPYPGRSIH